MQDQEIDHLSLSFKKALGFDYIKLYVCTYYKWDFFIKKNSKTFTEWVTLYLGIVSFVHDKLVNFDMPLAELSGEIAGGLQNPQGLKEYTRAKEAAKRLKDGQASHDVSSDGGFVVTNNTIKGDKIVNSATGEEVMSLKDLEGILKGLK